MPSTYCARARGGVTRTWRWCSRGRTGWNLLVSGLLVEATVVLFDGNPGYPDLGALWRLAGRHKVSYFGTSAPFIQSCLNRGGVRMGTADFYAVVEGSVMCGYLRPVRSVEDPVPFFFGPAGVAAFWSGLSAAVTWRAAVSRCALTGAR
jgi:hypothetical protein